MTTNTTPARWAARATAGALWIVGSAYLIKGELGHASPDYVLVSSIPIIWLVVCALPILVSAAIRDRQLVAAGVLALGALVGSAYTLTGTLGRQSELRDARAVEATELAKQRAAIQVELDNAKAMLAEAVAKCGKGRVCRESTKATISVYTGAVAGHRARLADLKPLPPPGVELRVASALALIRGGAPSDYMTGVGLFLPCLFGLLCELGMLGAAMYGFHPRRTVHVDAKTVSQNNGLASEPASNAGKASTLAVDWTETDKLTDDDLRRLRDLILGAGRALNNNEVRDLMGVRSKGTASKAVSRCVAAGLLDRRRVGREVAISATVH